MTTQLITELIADSSKFREGINLAKSDAASFSSAVKAGSIVVTAAFTAMAAAATFVGKEIFDAAEKVTELYNNAKKVGVTVSALQELSVAAKEAGVGTDQLSSLLGFMNKNLGAAELGGGNASKALITLGISLKDLQNLTTDQKFELIASKLKQVKDITLETSLATDLFGKQGKNAIGLFNSNIDESIAKVRALGITLTDSQAEGLHNLTATKDLIGTIWEGFKDNVASDVAPAFQELLNEIVSGIKGMGGLKDAAKQTADYIVSAMRVMETAISASITVMKAAKAIYDGISNTGVGSLISEAKDLLVTYTKAITYPGRAAISSLAGNNAPAGDQFSHSKSYTAQDYNKDMGVGVGAGIKTPEMTAFISAQVQSAIATSAATAALTNYTKSNTDAAAALKLLKTQSEKAAEVLDSFHAIKDDFAAPGKEQAKNIIKEATSSTNTGTLLADSTKFQQIFDQIIKDVQTKNTLDGGGKSEIPSMLKELQEIINLQKEGYNTTEGFVKPKDTSGLVNALNELKGFLASKTQAKDQQVEVKIKVDANENFITHITTTQTFKQAVDQEFLARTAAAARGNIP